MEDLQPIRLFIRQPFTESGKALASNKMKAPYYHE